MLLAENEANNPNDNPHTFHVLRTYIFGEKKKGEKSHIFNNIPTRTRLHLILTFEVSNGSYDFARD